MSVELSEGQPTFGEKDKNQMCRTRTEAEGMEQRE